MRENPIARKPEIVQAEQTILKHMEAIRDIMLDLDLPDPYLSLTITSSAQIMFNNTYWELLPSEGINYGLNGEVDECD